MRNRYYLLHYAIPFLCAGMYYVERKILAQEMHYVTEAGTFLLIPRQDKTVGGYSDRN